MNLDIYVSALQVEDFNAPLSVGSWIPLELLGYWGGALGQEVQALEAYQSLSGNRALRRIGLVEYAFSGEILEIRSLEDYGGAGTTYTEVLLDCGLPIVLIAYGRTEVWAENLDNRLQREIAVRRYLSGLMLLDGRISLRYPQLIVRELKAKITSIAQLNLLPDSERLAELRHVEKIDPAETKFPLILGVDIQPEPSI